jgi:hypothetical protein
LHLSACSAFLPEKQEVDITASEPGMEIYVNNEDVGPSPAKVDLNRDQAIEVSDGIKTVQIGRKVSLTGALDIAGTILFLFPLIGCFTLDPYTSGNCIRGRRSCAPSRRGDCHSPIN